MDEKGNEIDSKRNLGEGIAKQYGLDGIDQVENTTKYGEFVSSYFVWLTLDKQKENAKRMDEITKNSK